PLDTVGVIGGGTMGAGIVVALLDAGLPTVMVEQDDAALERGRKRVEQVYDLLVKKGRMTADERRARLARFTGATHYDALAGADLIIEAVF
ncbi:3-hydroxyacyl-CoA dehydrogenase NAD-binding domain-containing protein, partial [Cupriavidus sp. SIMBA_020]|uniref:3-hydroxyacyl-CoA dehydrogenase NAD-binding domain-containing protein n=1 Tax=Cupriavidus sp. SIMBA_020 TaxID=3085766 RepID=UPI00397D166A